MAIKLMVKQACAGILLDPGMGKTSISYAMYLLLKRIDPNLKMLVVAPRRVCYNVWPKQKGEWADFRHLRVAILHGDDKEAILASDDYDIYCVNPEGLEWLLQAKYEKRKKKDKDVNVLVGWNTDRIKKFGVLLVDESTKFKHSGTNRFELMKKMVPKFRRRYILTGTPCPNGLLDLFGQIYILDEGESLGAFITHYRKKFFYPEGYGGYTWTPKDDALERITERIAPLTLRLRAEDYLELPELIVQDIYVDLPPDAMHQYKLMEKEFVAMVEKGLVVAANAGVASSKCRQIAQGAIYVQEEGMKKHSTRLHEAKKEAFCDLEEQLMGAPILVGYEFGFDPLMLCRERLGKNPREDSRLIGGFSKGTIPTLLVQNGAVSGLDSLQRACNHVCFYGLPWNLEHYQQFIDRVRRQGSRAKTVFVYRIVARGTVDERIIEVLSKKDATQRDVMDMLQRLRKDYSTEL